MIYRTNTGEQYEANGFMELVCKMNDNSKFGKREDLAQFMKETAAACNLQTGAIITYDNPEKFIADLIAEGFLEIEEDGEEEQKDK